MINCKEFLFFNTLICIALSEPIDVFSEWVDAIESQDKKKMEPTASDESLARKSGSESIKAKKEIKKSTTTTTSSKRRLESDEESEGSFLDDDASDNHGFSDEESEAQFSEDD